MSSQSFFVEKMGRRKERSSNVLASEI